MSDPSGLEGLVLLGRILRGEGLLALFVLMVLAGCPPPASPRAVAPP